jgi:hypothetical protein
MSRKNTRNNTRLKVIKKTKLPPKITLSVPNTADNFYSYNITGMITFQYQGEEFHCSSLLPHSDLKESDYLLEFLDSAYYQLEDDIHSVYIEGKCVGVIIPLSFLSERDSDVIKSVKSFFQRYADLGIRKILSLNLLDKIEKYDFSIEELFPERNNLSVFVFDKSLLKKTDLMRYLPSLYDAGYCYVKDPLRLNQLYLSELRKQEVEEKRRLKQVKIHLFDNMDYRHNATFYDELFVNILPYNTQLLYRYIMLYQTIEIFSSYASYNIFVDSSEKYSNHQISQNDLREELHKSTTEKELINKIFVNMCSSGDYYDMFILSVSDLLNDIGYDCSKLKNYGQYMYAMRNRIVHETRSLINHMDKMRKVVDLYEKTTILLLKDSGKIKMSSKKVRVIK